MRTAVQCDFDGTVTEVEISHLLLSEFACDDWRSAVNEFEAGRMPVKECMEKCFATIQASEDEMIQYLLRNRHIVLRRGFGEFYKYCRQQGHYLTIVSNGLIFYIQLLLQNIGVNDIDIFAARSECGPEGMHLIYDGPDGVPVNSDFKEAYTDFLEKEGYRVVCIGDSISDMIAARRAAHVFATGTLVACCRGEGIVCTPFNTFDEVIRGMNLFERGELS